VHTVRPSDAAAVPAGQMAQLDVALDAEM